MAASNGWSEWTIGPDAARTLNVERSFLSRPEPNSSYKPENDGIAKLISTLKKAGLPGQPPQTTEVDLDGDGRKDVVIWQVTYQSFRTDFYVFLRGADGRLPERPTQILHCRGLPIPVNSTWTRSPIADLSGNGKYELVLLEPDFIVTSIGSLVDMALTRGTKFAISVRTFNHGIFARSGDTAASFRVQLSLYGSWEWPFLICGDFNGDGRPDLIVMRSATQWEVYFSTSDGHWFEPQPAMTFELPAQGYFERRYLEISDLNGDRRADIVSHDLDDPRIFILLTRPENRGRDGALRRQRHNPRGHPFGPWFPYSIHEFQKLSMNYPVGERTRTIPPALRAVTAVAAPLAKSAIPTIESSVKGNP